MALPTFDLNYLAIIVAFVASFLFGWLWHGPIFGKTWMKLMGFTEKSMKGMKMTPKMSMGLAVVFGLIATFVLAMFVDFLQATTIIDALIVGFLVWLGFILPIMAGKALWEGKSWSLVGFNLTYHIINVWIITVILTLWV